MGGLGKTSCVDAVYPLSLMLDSVSGDTVLHFYVSCCVYARSKE
jgi:hypothetical protein